MTSRPHNLLVLAMLACACGPGDLGDLPGTGGQEGDSSGTSDGGDREWVDVRVTPLAKLDILFVVDNSGTMGARQARLVESGAVLMDLLDDDEIHASYRVAVTTTDLGNPACSGTTPEDGAFVASSCRARLEQFAIDGTDDTQTACLDLCPDVDLAFSPTTTALDPNASPRPWLERIDGVANVGIETRDAFACLLPQGIDGCRFVSPLEAAYRALERARDPGDPAYGFLREDAHLIVVLVTDGSDCSVTPLGEDAFRRPEDCSAPGQCTQSLWSDPSAEGPTPAVCWNGGVACTGAMPNGDGTTSFASCVAADKGLGGSSGDASAAVLHPVSRYVDQLEALRTEKLGTSVQIIAIAGVDPSQPDEASFDTSADAQEQREHGIAPACRDEDDAGIGIAPLRIRAVMDASMDAGSVDSICQDDFTDGLSAVSASIRDQIEPACVPQCAADLDASTPGLQPDCELRETSPSPDGDVVRSIERCAEDGGLPDGLDICWAPLVDRDGATSSTDDDLSTYCVDAGANVEVTVTRREGHPAIGGTSIEIACTPSDTPESDCPGLG